LATPDLSAATREQLTRILGERANYVTLKEGTKEPTGTYRLKEGRKARARVTEVPKSGNYGVIPSSDFFVLDIDIHKAPLKASEEFFERFLGVTLSETLSVKSPSGGRHYYLRIPGGGTIFNGSLRPYAKKLAELIGDEVAPLIDADIRSSDAAGYVVGPGSYVSQMKDGAAYPTPGSYILQGRSREILRSGDFSQLEEISPNAARILGELRVSQKERKLSREPKAPKQIPVHLVETKPDAGVVILLRAGLRKKLKRSPDIEYYRRRAFVTAALQCCYSDYTIAIACLELEIDRDSYTSKRISLWQIIEDVRRFRENHPNTEHTVYCPVGRREVAEQSPRSLESVIEENRRKIRERTLAMSWHRRDPRVVHIERVLLRLDAHKRKKIPQVMRDAVLILDAVFQPLLNVGASRVVLAIKPVAEALELTPSRVSAATRLLREKRIISLVDRQRTGMAPTYTVTSGYIHRPLTGALKHQWNLNKAETGKSTVLVYDRFTKLISNLHTGEVYTPDSEMELPKHKELATPPAQELEIFVRRYLHKQFEAVDVA